MQRTLKLHKLPDTTRTPGFRKLTEKDLPQARKLLSNVGIHYENKLERKPFIIIFLFYFSVYEVL